MLKLLHLECTNRVVDRSATKQVKRLGAVEVIYLVEILVVAHFLRRNVSNKSCASVRDILSLVERRSIRWSPTLSFGPADREPLDRCEFEYSIWLRRANWRSTKSVGAVCRR